MSGLTLLFLFAFAMVALAPETHLGKMLRQALVAAPAQMLNGGPIKLLAAAFVLVGVLGFAFAAPELIALVGVADLALYLDVMAVALIVGAIAQFRGFGSTALRWARRYLLGPAIRLRPGRGRRPRSPVRKPRSDDDDGPFGAWTLA